MPFVDSSMWESRAIDHKFIVPKSIADWINWYAQIPESIPQVHNLLNASSSRDESRSISSGLQCGLLLRVPPHDGCLVSKMNTSSN